MLASAAVPVDDSAKAQKTDKPSVIKNASLLQLPFIANQGQIKNQQVKYYAQTFGGSAHITHKSEIIYQFADINPKGADSHSRTRRIWTLKETLIGAAVKPPRGIDPSQTKVNYFIGNDKGC